MSSITERIRSSALREAVKPDKPFGKKRGLLRDTPMKKAFRSLFDNIKSKNKSKIKSSFNDIIDYYKQKK